MLELERLYNLLIAVEDCEKKLLALPTNTSMRVQVKLKSISGKLKIGMFLSVWSQRLFCSMQLTCKIIRKLKLISALQNNVFTSVTYGLKVTNVLGN